MKSTIYSECSQIARLIAERGWAEGTAGNLSLLMKKGIAEAGNVNEKFRYIKNLKNTYPFLSHFSFIMSQSGCRMRDLAEDPLHHTVVIRLSEEANTCDCFPDEESFMLGRQPTSELSAHLLIHNLLQKIRPDMKAVIHTHATELIALTQLKEFTDEESLNTLLWSMHPEVKMFIPGGLGIVPFKLPGTSEIATETVKSFRDHQIVVWEKHGIFAAGQDLAAAFDLVDIACKAAKIFFLCRSAGQDPEGLSPEQLNELDKYYRNL